jgi:hypothetical protein
VEDEVSIVKTEIAGMGMKKARIAKLPPEFQDNAIRDIMKKYGDPKVIYAELWSRVYIYPVANGIRIVDIQLKQHIPTHMLIVGQRVLILYDGQPTTCYGCNATGHQYNECPTGKMVAPPAQITNSAAWAQVVAQGPIPTQDDVLPNDKGDERGTPNDVNNEQNIGRSEW